MDVRTLAPNAPAISAGALHAALTRAAWIVQNEQVTDPVSRGLARALLYLYGEAVILEGDTLKFSVALLRHLYEMPEHESAVVRFVRGPAESDGTRVLMLQPIDQPWVCSRRSEGGA